MEYDDSIWLELIGSIEKSVDQYRYDRYGASPELIAHKKLNNEKYTFQNNR